MHCGEITGKEGYDRLAKESFGRRWKMIVGIAQLVQLVGVVVTYLTLVRFKVIIEYSLKL